MTIKDIIRMADGIKPNAFDADTKTAWLNEVEGLVQTEVMLIAPPDIARHEYCGYKRVEGEAAPKWEEGVYYINRGGAAAPVYLPLEKQPEDWEESFGSYYLRDSSLDGAVEMLVKPPHDKLYCAYLCAMIDFANGEYGRYHNSMELFNTYFSEYQRWYARTYDPAGGEAVQRGYYLSAYAIAVKYGYKGSEEEWARALSRGLPDCDAPPSSSPPKDISKYRASAGSSIEYSRADHTHKMDMSGYDAVLSQALVRPSPITVDTGILHVEGILKGSSYDGKCSFARAGVDYADPAQLDTLSGKVDAMGYTVDNISQGRVYKGGAEYTVKANKKLSAIWEAFRIPVKKLYQWGGPSQISVDGEVGAYSASNDAAQCAFTFQGMGDVSPANTLEIMLYLDGSVNESDPSVVFEIYEGEDMTKHVQWYLGSLSSEMVGGWHMLTLPLAAIDRNTVGSNFAKISGGRFFAYGKDKSDPVKVAVGSASLIYSQSSQKSVSEGCVISYDINGASGVTPPSSRCVEGAVISLPESAGNKYGYAFKGWREEDAT